MHLKFDKEDGDASEKDERDFCKCIIVNGIKLSTPQALLSSSYYIHNIQYDHQNRVSTLRATKTNKTLKDV